VRLLALILLAGCCGQGMEFSSGGGACMPVPGAGEFRGDEGDICDPRLAHSEVEADPLAAGYGWKVVTRAGDCRGSCTAVTGRFRSWVQNTRVGLVDIPVLTHSFSCTALDAAPDAGDLGNILPVCAEQNEYVILEGEGGVVLYPEACLEFPLGQCPAGVGAPVGNVGACALQRCAEINTFDLGPGAACGDGGLPIVVGGGDGGMPAVAEMEEPVSCEEAKDVAYAAALNNLPGDVGQRAGSFLYSIMYEGDRIDREGDPNAALLAWREFEIFACDLLIILNNPELPGSGNVFCSNAGGNPRVPLYRTQATDMVVPPALWRRMLLEGEDMDPDTAVVHLPAGRRRYADGLVRDRGPWPDARGILCEHDRGWDSWNEIIEMKYTTPTFDPSEWCLEIDINDADDLRRGMWACERWYGRATQAQDYLAHALVETTAGRHTDVEYWFGRGPSDDFALLIGALPEQFAHPEFGRLMNTPKIIPIPGLNEIPVYFADRMVGAGERGLLHPPIELGLQGGDLGDLIGRELDRRIWPEMAADEAITNFNKQWRCGAPGSRPDIRNCADYHFDLWTL